MRPLIALGAAALLLAPTSVAAQDDGAPITTVDGADFVLSDDRDAFAILTRLPGVLADDRLAIVRTEPATLPSPLDETPSDATIYRIEAPTDPGPFLYGRLQAGSELSFVEGRETPAILRVAIGSDAPAFLDGQRVLRLPPPCADGAAIGADCVSAEVGRSFYSLFMRDWAADLGIELDVDPDPGDFDVLTGGTMAGDGTIVGFGGGIFTDADVDPVVAGDSYEIRATQTISDLFGGDVERTTASTYHYDPDTGELMRVGQPIDIPRGGGINVPCEPGLRGLFLLETSITGAGRNLPETVGPGFDELAAGTDILLNQIHPFICGTLPLTDDRGGIIDDVTVGGPGTDGAVSLVCVRGESNHTEHETKVGRRDVIFPTTGDFEGAVVVTLPDLFTDPPDPFRLDVTIDGANRDRPIRTDLELVDSSAGWFEQDAGWGGEAEPDRSFDETWNALIDDAKSDGRSDVGVARFDFKAGVDGTGRKAIRKAIVRAGDQRADITDQFIDSLGTKRLRIRFPQEDTWGDGCTLPPDGSAPAEEPYLPIALR